MKNIHILQTDKPSRLFLKETTLLLNNQYTLQEVFPKGKCQNIYITSDEEINQQTKPCWCVNTIKNTWDKDLIYYQGTMPQYHYVGFKRIILTTDEDLIKDGIQPINDEFLEWFVNNPSCEEVEVRDIKTIPALQLSGNNHLCYKIIIPQEESTQDNNFFESLKKYFETTPHDEVMAAWERSKQFDKVGPTVNEFLDNTNKQKILDISKVTRVEVIQHSEPYNGRAYTNYNAKDVEIQLQDDNKTLKIFLK